MLGKAVLMNRSILSHLPDPNSRLHTRYCYGFVAHINQFPARKAERGGEVQVVGVIDYGVAHLGLFCFCGAGDAVWCQGADAV